MKSIKEIFKYKKTIIKAVLLIVLIGLLFVAGSFVFKFIKNMLVLSFFKGAGNAVVDNIPKIGLL